jgi:hypothetical protein
MKFNRGDLVLIDCQKLVSLKDDIIKLITETEK